jgi:peptidoglycan/xylan/chitin deacetylase (PgdA/CDA1 family)
MEMDDLFWLRDNGHSIGAHTKSHPCLYDIDEYSKMYDEITGSADRLEKLLGIEIKNFAFPFGRTGSVNNIALKIASERFDHAFSNIRGSVSASKSRNFVFRQNIVPNDPLLFSVACVFGKLDFKYLSERKLII